MPTAPVPMSAYQLALFRAALDLAKNLGGFGSQVSHVKVLTFQQLWNRAISAGAITSGAAPLREDGVWGPNTAGALTHALPTGLPAAPANASLGPSWWAPIGAEVMNAAASIQAQLAAQVSTDMPPGTPSADAQRTINQAIQAPLNTMQNAQAAANTDVPQGAGGASSPSSSGPIALPGSLVQGRVSATQGLAWPWVVGGLSVATLVVVLGWAAYRKGKRRQASTGKR